jgi:hypothetical protein
MWGAPTCHCQPQELHHQQESSSYSIDESNDRNYHKGTGTKSNQQGPSVKVWRTSKWCLLPLIHCKDQELQSLLIHLGFRLDAAVDTCTAMNLAYKAYYTQIYKLYPQKIVAEYITFKQEG